MSALFPYLNISLRFVRGAKATTVFTYPENEKPVRPQFNSAAILNSFVNLHEMYVTGCHNSTRYYTFVNVDETDPEQARLELTIAHNSNILVSGRSVISLVSAIKNIVEQEDDITDAKISKAIAEAGFDETPLTSAAEYPGNNVTDNPCFRTYMSATDLATILSFPRQSAYAQYSEVALVHLTAVVAPEHTLPQITEPIVQAFSVVCPEGVTASQDSVELTDHLALTYSCPGFDDTTVTFEVGTTNRYVRISGPALVANPADKAGVVFTRQLPYSVVNVKGQPVSTYTILINGRTANRADSRFEVASSDFTNDGKVNIQVSSTNYFTTSLDYTPAELFASSPLEIVLVAEELPVVLRLDFGDGRMVEQEITFEKSTPEYRLLRAGNFHGFRAHRVMGGEPETYNIILSTPAAPAAAASATTAQPEAPATQPEPARTMSAAEMRAERRRAESASINFTTPATEEPKAAQPAEEQKHKPVAPVFETEKPSAKPRKAYADDIPRKVDILADDPDDDDERPRRRLVSPIVIAAVAIVLITAGIVYYLFTLLPSDNSDDSDIVDITTAEATSTADQGRISIIDDQPATEAQPAAQPAAETKPAGPTADETADVEYLNKNTTWRLADLKSDKYRAFFALFAQGDIDKIAQSDYYAVKDQASNKKAVAVADYLWKAKGTFAEKRNVKALKELDGKESIDIQKLYDDLSRMQDAKPNTEPRPQR